MNSGAVEKRLAELEGEFLTRKMDSAETAEIVSELRMLSQSSGSKWARLLELLYQSNLHASEYEKSRSFVDHVELLDLSKQLKKPYFTYLILNRRGYYYRQNGDVLTAFDNTWKALECLYQNRDTIPEKLCMHGIRCLENNIGVTLLEEGNYREALEYFERDCQEIVKNAGDEQEIIISYYILTNCIQCYYALDEGEKALCCAREVIGFAAHCPDRELHVRALIWSFITEDRYGDAAVAEAFLPEIDLFQENSEWFTLMPILIGYLRESGRESLALCYINLLFERGKAEDNFRYMLDACLQQKKFYEHQEESVRHSEEYKELCVRIADLMIRKEEVSAQSRRESLMTYMRVAEESKKQEALLATHDLLKHKSEYDELTGLSNRYRLSEFCQSAFRRAYQEGLTLFMEIIDVDFFKEVNDDYGHAQGDECLKRLAEVLQSTVKADSDAELCARLGGDEFVIVRLGRKNVELLCKMEELRQNVMALAIPNRSSQTAGIVTISQGAINRTPREKEELTDFLKWADGCLYEAKKKSRNTIVLYHEDEMHQ